MGTERKNGEREGGVGLKFSGEEVLLCGLVSQEGSTDKQVNIYFWVNNQGELRSNMV
jgi:hypothetical protein